MSFPNIPDVDPVIDIDLCDAVNLLLTSIAMEEISLSNLIDSERDKIQYALELFSRREITPQDVISINRSVDDMLKTIISLQMLLRFKLEDAIELIPCCPTTSSTSTTSTSTTTSTTCTCSSTTDPCFGCGLMGNARGCIDNQCDPYYGRTIELHTFIPCDSNDSNSIRLTIGSESDGLQLYASGKGVNTVCSDCDTMVITVTGRGRLRQFFSEKETCDTNASYTLTVRSTCCQRVEFRIQISSTSKPCLNYDSGFLRTYDGMSDLRIYACV